MWIHYEILDVYLLSYKKSKLKWLLKTFFTIKLLHKDDI